MCRNRHRVARPHRSIPSIVFNSVLNSSIHSQRAQQNTTRNRGGVAPCSETILYVSTIREVVVCKHCNLKQFERPSTCRRCHESLDLSYFEIHLSSSLVPLSSQRENTIRKEVGGLIRRLRARRQMTQATLASLTGINRTYLSRAERGKVLPSVIALMQIAHALEVDKILLRVRSSSN